MSTTREDKPVPRNIPARTHFIAGGVGGALGSVITCPLEVIKTRLQARHNKHLLTAGSNKARFGTAVFKSIRDVYRSEGLFGLWKGTGPFLVGVAPSRALWFTTYQKTKQHLTTKYGSTYKADYLNAAAGVTAGLTVATITCPIWLVKTRMQLQIAQDRQYKNAFDCVRKVYAEEGPRGFYKGLVPSYLGVFESTLQLVFYERLKVIAKRLKLANNENKQNISEVSLGKIELTLVSGLAKITACALTYPHEVIRTRVREQKNKVGDVTAKYRGVLHTFSTIFKEEGPRALYGGMAAHMFRVVPNAAILFVTYESVVAYIEGTE